MLTRDEAIRFLLPKWQVLGQQRDDADRSWLLMLDSGHTVEIDDAGWFHVSGKGWKAINRRLQEAQWPANAADLAGLVRDKLAALPQAQQRYFIEGLHCLQHARAPRAAIVLGWAGFIDALHRRLAADLPALNAARAKRFPKLQLQFTGLDSVRELQDWQSVDLGFERGFYPKVVYTQLQAMREQRNECAHIETVEISIDMALGYYSHLAMYAASVQLPDAPTAST